MTDDTREILARIAQRAEQDIDAGTIKLTGDAADHELARLAEQKRAQLERPAPTPPHAAYSAPTGASFCCGNQCPGLSYRATPQSPHPETCLAAGQVDGDQETPRTLLTEVIEGLLGKETPECRAAIERYFGFEPLEQLAHYGTVTTIEQRAAIRNEIERRKKERAPTEIHVDVPAGFVPDYVATNRATKAVTFNGAELGPLVTCPRCDQRMRRRGVVRGVDTGGRIAPDEWVCPCGLSCTAEAAAAEHVRAGFAATKRRAAEAATVPNEKEQEALAFCFRAAAGDSGGQRRVRQFLFAWHNAGELGGFDFADLWSLDAEHLAAVLTLINMIARGQTGYYPHHYGYEADMEALIETYGPLAVGDRVEGDRWRDVSAQGRVVRIVDARVAHVEWDGGGRAECVTSELRRL